MDIPVATVIYGAISLGVFGTLAMDKVISSGGPAFKLDAIASIGSAVALVIFTLITAAHLRIRSETRASLPSIGLDYGWKRNRPSRPVHIQVGH